jgi:hypothetical protein
MNAPHVAALKALSPPFRPWDADSAHPPQARSNPVAMNYAELIAF